MQIDCSLQIIKSLTFPEMTQAEPFLACQKNIVFNVHINVRQIFVLNLNVQDQYSIADIWSPPVFEK